MDSRPKILIVDDEKKNVAFLSGLLEPHGYDVIGALNGEEALKSVNEQKVDAILMDIMMPVMDGITATKAIRQDKRFKDIPVIMITVQDHESTILESLDCGADDYIVKPYEVHEIIKKVGENIEKAKLGSLPSQLYYRPGESS